MARCTSTKSAPGLIRSSPRHTVHCMTPYPTPTSCRIDPPNTSCSWTIPPCCTAPVDMCSAWLTSTLPDSSTLPCSCRCTFQSSDQLRHRTFPQHTCHCMTRSSAQRRGRTAPLRTTCTQTTLPRCTAPRDRSQPSRSPTQSSSSTPPRTARCSCCWSTHTSHRTAPLHTPCTPPRHPCCTGLAHMPLPSRSSTLRRSSTLAHTAHCTSTPSARCCCQTTPRHMAPCTARVARRQRCRTDRWSTRHTSTRQQRCGFPPDTPPRCCWSSRAGTRSQRCTAHCTLPTSARTRRRTRRPGSWYTPTRPPGCTAPAHKAMQ